MEPRIPEFGRYNLTSLEDIRVEIIQGENLKIRVSG
jgi:hypothetical protein